MGDLQIGGGMVPLTDATRWVKAYVREPSKPDEVFGYPHYDFFQTDSDVSELSDGDLLAPLLLNAAPSLAAFHWLKEIRGELEGALADIDPDLTLVEASSESLGVFRRLYAPLDARSERWGVGGTILSKLLHRKRPAFIPIYDSRIWHVYGVEGSAPLARGKGQERTWGEFFEALAVRMQTDLNADVAAWTALAQLPSKPISPLRALDIVAWTYGRNSKTASKAGDDERVP